MTKINITKSHTHCSQSFLQGHRDRFLEGCAAEMRQKFVIFVRWNLLEPVLISKSNVNRSHLSPAPGEECTERHSAQEKEL